MADHKMLLLTGPELHTAFRRLRLPPRYHEVLSLHLLMFRPAEIAEFTSLRPSTVSRYLHEIRSLMGVAGGSDRLLMASVLKILQDLATIVPAESTGS